MSVDLSELKVDDYIVLRDGSRHRVRKIKYEKCFLDSLDYLIHTETKRTYDGSQFFDSWYHQDNGKMDLDVDYPGDIISIVTFEEQSIASPDSLAKIKELEIKFRKLSPNAAIPTRATEGAAGFDLVATSVKEGKGFVEYGTGLALEVPEGYVAKLYARSSLSKTGWYLCNGVGIGDSDYRGEYTFRFSPGNSLYFKLEDSGAFTRELPYKVGDRIGQVIIEKLEPVQFIEVEELSDTERGNGSYGSTGK